MENNDDVLEIEVPNNFWDLPDKVILIPKEYTPEGGRNG